MSQFKSEHSLIVDGVRRRVIITLEYLPGSFGPVDSLGVPLEPGEGPEFGIISAETEDGTPITLDASEEEQILADVRDSAEFYP